MTTRNDDVTKADDVQKKCLLMKENHLKSPKLVCGITKGIGGGIEMWKT